MPTRPTTTQPTGRFTVRGAYFGRPVAITWDHGRLTGDPDALRGLRAWAEALDGQPVGPAFNAATTTTADHLASPTSCYQLLLHLLAFGPQVEVDGLVPGLLHDEVYGPGEGPGPEPPQGANGTQALAEAHDAAATQTFGNPNHLPPGPGGGQFTGPGGAGGGGGGSGSSPHDGGRWRLEAVLDRLRNQRAQGGAAGAAGRHPLTTPTTPVEHGHEVIGRIAALRAKASIYQESRARQDERNAADPAIVRAEHDQWTGPKALQPPFSPKDFGEAVLTHNPDKRINASWTTTIHGEQYVIKQVTPYAAYMDHQVPNPVRYETHADAAAHAFVQAIGLEHLVHTTPTWAFEYGGEHLVASKRVDGMQMLLSVVGMHDQMAKAGIPTLRAMTIHDYLAGDPDRTEGNVLINTHTHALLEIDHARAFTPIASTAFHSHTSIASEVWYHAAGYDESAMHFDRAQLRAVVAREPQAVQVLRDYHLEAGIPRLEKRFEFLRRLAELPDPTAEDLSKIAR